MEQLSTFDDMTLAGVLFVCIFAVYLLNEINATDCPQLFGYHQLQTKNFLPTPFSSFWISLVEK